MKNWKILSDVIKEKTWSYIYDVLGFHPNCFETKLNNIPFPNRCFNIKEVFESSAFKSSYDEFHQFAVYCFQAIAPNNVIYAMDWQHDCYSFNPYLPFEKNEFYKRYENEWPIPFFPEADHYFFMTVDCLNGFFIDGINFNIYIWGEHLMEVINKTNLPQYFKNSSHI
jgi:Protein of unknown function (DUF2716)